MEIKIEKPTPEQIKMVTGWPIWDKGVCVFDMEYENEEVFYVIEGKAEITSDSKDYEFSKGDLVTIPKGAICKWKITEPIKKHYQFR